MVQLPPHESRSKLVGWLVVVPRGIPAAVCAMKGATLLADRGDAMLLVYEPLVQESICP